MRLKSVALLMALLVAGLGAHGQSLKGTVKPNYKRSHWLRVTGVEYRAAKRENERLDELGVEKRNKGGLIHFYVTNVSNKEHGLHEFMLNGRKEGYWLLGRYISWHRTYDKYLSPGESTVLEINALDGQFSENSEFKLLLIDKTWQAAGYTKGILQEDPVRVSSMVLDRGLDQILFHVRNRGTEDIDFLSAEVVGHETASLEWKKGHGHSIGMLKLKTKLKPGELIILRVHVAVGEAKRIIHSHRRAYMDSFPIGVWKNEPGLYERFKGLHIDTVMWGGFSDNDFFSRDWEKYDFKAITFTNAGKSVDMIRDLGDSPAVRCWMIFDEPDWRWLPSDMLFGETLTKSLNTSIPTMITLCRSFKFFEFASISDIPVHDHYCIRAPTSTNWPKFYGTYLEETGFYTEYLKEASEPKPIWVWTQGIAGWGKLPQRYCPTANEIAAQLMLNLGYGAKGILWFNWDKQAVLDYPDSVEAYRDWGRVMRCIRPDILRSDPVQVDVVGPEKLDIAPLVSPDSLILCITNLDYTINAEAYPFVTKKDVKLEVGLPAWLGDVQGYSITAGGLQDHEVEIVDGKAHVALGDIEAARLVVLTADKTVKERHAAEYAQAIKDESKTYE